jgi:hypothetical protein
MTYQHLGAPYESADFKICLAHLPMLSFFRGTYIYVFKAAWKLFGIKS